MSGGRIVPEASELTAVYWAAAAHGRVLLQRCLEPTGCGLTWHPPAPTCPGGPSHTIEWFEASGQGRLHSYTRVEHAAHQAVLAALPYLVALVELAEGPRLICNLVDIDPADAPAQLRMDRPVIVSSGPAAGGLTLPVARLAP